MNLSYELTTKVVGTANQNSGSLSSGQDLLRVISFLALASPASGGANVPYAADLSWNGSLSIPPSTTQTLTLTDGSLVNPTFQTKNIFARIKAIIAINNMNASSAPNSIVLFGGTLGLAFPVHPGGNAMIVAPDASGIAVPPGGTITLQNEDPVNQVSFGLVLIGSAE